MVLEKIGHKENFQLILLYRENEDWFIIQNVWFKGEDPLKSQPMVLYKNDSSPGGKIIKMCTDIHHQLFPPHILLFNILNS